jgi:divalent metal cation (Fe/Co/Zn/Cd) transporter
VEDIRRVALTVYGIIDTEKCFIRKSGMKYHVDLHATVNADLTVKEGHTIAHNLKDLLRSEIPQLGHVIIHIEPGE